ncbi:MAG: OmpA family protein [Planctomycetaceae bacterium]|nr:OmpA family protein [Planctomycetaceae bacterium]
MPLTTRLLLVGAFGLAAVSQTGCNMVPRSQVACAQNRTRQLYEQNKALALERQTLLSQVHDLQANGDTMRARIENLQAERNHFSNVKSTNPLSDSANRQFEDLARRYPGFDFDPTTGVSKIQNEILFESGSDELRPEAAALLREFAGILNAGDAADLNVLVVGHTDDQPVVKASTKQRHPNNWYLSAHRAIGVVDALKKSGIKETRMGASEYGPHQPRVAAKTPEARRQNRRVEIFVLAPNASMAGWDPGTSRK